MISLVRIDDRLIHGQVAVVWTKHLGVNPYSGRQRSDRE